MGDYADAGYQLQHYKITFYADNDGKIPLKVVHRAFASYDCAKMWEADVMYRRSCNRVIFSRQRFRTAYPRLMKQK